MGTLPGVSARGWSAWLGIAIAALAGAQLGPQQVIPHGGRLAILVGADGGGTRGQAQGAKELGALLTSQFGYRAEDVTVLAGAKATADGVRRVLSRLDNRNGVQPDQTVFLFIAGPKGLQAKDEVLPPSGGASALTMADVWGAVAKCAARDVLVAIDACGVRLPTAMRSPDAPVVRELLCAGDVGQTVHALPDSGDSVFVRALVKELSAAGPTAEAADAGRNVYPRVRADVAFATSDTQSPQYDAGGSGAAFNFAAGLTGVAAERADVGRTVVSLEFQNADVRDALRDMFRHVDANFTIAPDVQGTVTIKLQNVPFDEALNSVLGQVGGAVVKEGGVYMIQKSADAAGGRAPSDDVVITSLDFDQVDARDAIKYLFKQVNANYTVAPEVQGTVTLTLRNVTFNVALRNLLDQIRATFVLQDGIYRIVRRET